jgi:antitoxin CcdA
MERIMPVPKSPRRPLNISLPANLVAEAKRLGVNVSQACEQGLQAVVKQARTEAWLKENAEAIAYWNAHREANGMTLAEFRPVYDDEA